MAPSIIPAERIRAHIYEIRGHRIMLDSDLAVLYGVQVRALNQAVRRNLERFPQDFMFELTADEYASLRSQSVIVNKGRGRHRKHLPLAFTEEGVAALSGVLRSPRAIQVNIEIVRTFVQLRRFALSNDALRTRLDEVEKRMDRGFRSVFDDPKANRERRPQTHARLRSLG